MGTVGTARNRTATLLHRTAFANWWEPISSEFGYIRPSKKKIVEYAYSSDLLQRRQVEFSLVNNTFSTVEVAGCERLCCGHRWPRLLGRGSVSSEVLNTFSCKECSEGYVQALFVTCAAGQHDDVHHVLLCAPLLLEHGESMAALLGCTFARRHNSQG
eukprot:5845013-Amphidinium_carterae.3